MVNSEDRNLSEESLFDVLERIRAERYSHIDRDVVRELLKLHAEPASSELELVRSIDEQIFMRTGN